MNSMNSGHNRAATLKEAARRNLFIARIQKYEAKMKQDRKARSLLGEHKSAILDQQVGDLEQKVCLAKKSLPERIELLCDNRTLDLEESKSILKEKKEFTTKLGKAQLLPEEREDSPEQKTISEQTQISSTPSSVPKGINRAAMLGLKPVSRNSRTTPGAFLPLAPAGKVKVHGVEMKPLGGGGGQAVTVTKFKSSAGTEGNMATAAEDFKIRLKAADMTSSMRTHAFRCARETLDSSEKLHCKHVAHTLKKEFDQAYGPAWHCIVGSSFGSFVTHSLGGFIYFSIDKISILLFKTTVELTVH
eukprot:c22199_g1_i1 orf=1091-1999(+)